jgi:FixJ family two-component response regulator
MAKRVFVVDDDKCIADTLAVILRNPGYQATAFYTAPSALARKIREDQRNGKPVVLQTC